MHHCRLQFTQQPYQGRVTTGAMAWRLVQCVEANIVTADAMAEIGHIPQGQHRMPIGLRRHVIDQIGNAILQSASGKLKDDVQHQRAIITRNRAPDINARHRQSRQTRKPALRSCTGLKAAFTSMKAPPGFRHRPMSTIDNSAYS